MLKSIGGLHMKKRFFSLVVAAVIGINLIACGRNTCSMEDKSSETDREIVIGFSQIGAESDWRIANTESMKTTFSEENGYKLFYHDAQQKPANQIEAIRNFIQQEVDYIVLAPSIETGWDTVLEEAKAASIPVIIVDRMIDVSDESLYTAWVGADFYEEGQKAVRWMEEQYGKEKTLNIAHIQGTIGSSAQIGRTKALEEAVAQNENWNLSFQQSGDFTEAKSKEVMGRILRNTKDIDVVYCENDNIAFGAIEAIESAGLECGLDGDITVVSFDATHAGLEKTMSGSISCNIECNPLHGPRVEKIIEQLEHGETPDKLSYVAEEVFQSDELTETVINSRMY